MRDKKSQIALLLAEIHQGSISAFNELFILCYDRLVAFAMQYTKECETAEEITSELFVKIWIKRAELLKIADPQVYLFIAVKNACLNVLRDQKKHKRLFTEQAEDVAPEFMVNSTIPMEDSELTRILNQAVNTLPEQRRIIFKLIKEDGLKTKAVAEILGISARTVENQLYKAVKTLADALSSYLGYHPQKRTLKKSGFSDIHMLFFL